ncbi:MAG: TolC family protein [Bacteroidales bacterium]|nr:TolC family protein [Bacteroidales bacterium]
MEYAVEHSARVKVAQADLSDTRVERREAVLKTFTPQVSASSYGYYNWGRSVDPETNTYSNIKSFHNGYSLSAGLALFDGFQAVNNMKISKTSLLMGISREQQAEDEVCLATMEAWSNVLYYSELSRILEDQVAAAQLSLDKARKEEQLGKKAYADVVQMEAELADKQYQSLQAKGKADDALLTLKSVMMWPLDTPLVLDSQEPSRLADNASKNQEDIAHIVDYALAHNPQAIIAEGNVSNARRQLSMARWQLAPSLNLSGGWSTTYFTYPGRAGYTPVPFREQLKNNRGEYIQLSINIPIYNRLQAQSSVIRRKNAYDRAVAERDQKMTELEAEVKRAVQDRDNTLSSWKLALKRAEVQQEAYKLNVKKYDQGMISSIEYQSAVNNWLQAQADRLQAQLTYMIKEKVLRYYQGQSYLSQR